MQCCYGHFYGRYRTYFGSSLHFAVTEMGREDGKVNLEGYSKVKPYADNGSLFGTTNHEATYPVMPTNGVKIPFCEIEQMRLWIENGAQNN